MRVSSYAQPSHIPPIAPSPVQAAPPAPAQFLPFSAEAFQQARTRDVPVLLFISDAPPTLSDAALSMQIAERTVPVWLYPGMRPDVELLCQRAGALFSEEGALPLCALMLEDARVFLAAPLPPAKHVFTHKIWELGGWRGTAPACALPDGYVWAAPEDLAEVYPVPNAFGAYVKAK